MQTPRYNFSILAEKKNIRKWWTQFRPDTWDIPTIRQKGLELNPNMSLVNGIPIIYVEDLCECPISVDPNDVWYYFETERSMRLFQNYPTKEDLAQPWD